MASIQTSGEAGERHRSLCSLLVPSSSPALGAAPPPPTLAQPVPSLQQIPEDQAKLGRFLWAAGGQDLSGTGGHRAGLGSRQLTVPQA